VPTAHGIVNNYKENPNSSVILFRHAPKYGQWRKFTFSDGGGGGGAKPPKFPTKLSNFRLTPLFALEKAVFSPL
jgi:hypothetical protein